MIPMVSAARIATARIATFCTTADAEPFIWYLTRYEEARVKRLALIAGIAALILGACATAPDPVNPPDEEQQQARQLQTEVAENELAQYAEGAAARAEAALAEAEAAYDAEDYEVARTGYNEAIDNYRTVLSEGYAALVGARRSTATEARDAALDVRADVATPDLFNAAQATFEQAEAEAQDGDAAQAAVLFANAQAEYADATEKATDLRRQALEAVNSIDDRQNQLQQQRQELETEAEEDLTDPTTSEEE